MMWCARCLIGDCACDLDYEPQGFVPADELAETLMRMHRADLQLAITLVDGTAHCRQCVIRLHGVEVSPRPGVLWGLLPSARPGGNFRLAGHTRGGGMLASRELSWYIDYGT